MIKDGVFSFDDFLKENNEKGTEEEMNPYSSYSIHSNTSNKSDKDARDIEEDIEEPIKESIKINEEVDNFYPLYKDKTETFSCDIQVEGAKTSETISRLIVETNEWTLMFPGEIVNGKCTIPIRKLNIFDEGQTGKIRLEVIAEGSMFIPWEDEFKIKLSKKITVSMNEDKRSITKAQPSVGVKVNVKR